ncbi:MAG: tRNA (N(6)-L-threonylcarbamoyladenosine(37)-C(2))-methylthiotransferase MtaB [Chloroflexota bacterium]|nr:tRNA (N(6)-L-threonylcarbamoyladenosine(37)-C(2))-methylthiotransferase MtaB [Chloroflexota bacterium]
MIAFYLTSLGCKLNQAEIEFLSRRVEALGHEVVADPQKADWAIVNTCTVTHVAARKSRQLIRSLHREKEDLRLAVTGCYAEMSPQELEAIEGVDLVVSNAHKDEIVERILSREGEEWTQGATAVMCPPRRLKYGHTRAFVKIQDGCDQRCTYCIVTVARGPSRSRPPQEVLREVARRVEEGYKEVVLTGVNIDAYGRDRGSEAPFLEEGWSLARLVRTILDRTDVSRLRLSSLEPWDIMPDLLDLWPNERLCRHLHLSLQSGCDDTLRRMGRRYTTADFARFVRRIRRRVPEISITSEVIVGFPGETEEEFAESAAFIERMGFARLHVFRYSRREGTRAATMPNQVDPQIAKARGKRLRALGQEMALAFHRRFVHEDVEVLFESRYRAEGVLKWNGLTDNYLRVTVSSAEDLENRFGVVHCLRADEEGLAGELVTLAEA